MIAATIRNLRRSPAFVVIAAISLGTALGLSTAVFGLIDAMRHPASAVRDVDQIVDVRLLKRQKRAPANQEVTDALRAIPIVEQLGEFRYARMDVQLADQSADARVAFTRAGFWQALQMTPRLGRLPTAAEARDANVAVVSDVIWRSCYGNLPSIGSAAVIIAGQPYAIVGVLPRDGAIQSGNIFVPDPTPQTDGAWLVRLKRGSRQAQLQPFIMKETKRIIDLYLSPGEHVPVFLSLSLRTDPLGLQDFHRALIGSAFAVLLIACANVAALMLARGMVRRRDYSLKLALGAPPAKIFGDVLAEVFAVTIIGCAVGALVATWTIALMTRATPEEMHWLGFVAPQWSVRVFAQSAAAVFVSIAIAGGYPAWRASRTDPALPLKESSGGNTGRMSTRFRLLVIGELALAMTLLVSTSLMMKSVRTMEKFDFGYSARGLMLGSYRLSRRVPADQAAVGNANSSVLNAVRALPSVRSAAMTTACITGHQMVVSDRAPEGAAPIRVTNGCSYVVGPFFATMGVRVVKGRDFTDEDSQGTGAAVLDEKTAHALFPHDDPIGRLVKLGAVNDPAPWIPVVGVVAVRHDYTPFPEIIDSSMVVYAATPQMAADFGQIVFRPLGNVGVAGGDVFRTLRAVLPPGSEVQIQRWTYQFDDRLKQVNFLTLMFKMMGVASLLLGAAGLFSVISYVANRRMREFAVRIALGAPNVSIQRLVLRDALVMSLGGTAIGAFVGSGCGFLLWDKLWGVYPIDAAALVGAEVALILVTMLACLGPALRASRANPLEIIRAS